MSISDYLHFSDEEIKEALEYDLVGDMKENKQNQRVEEVKINIR